MCCDESPIEARESGDSLFQDRGPLMLRFHDAVARLQGFRRRHGLGPIAEDWVHGFTERITVDDDVLRCCLIIAHDIEERLDSTGTMSLILNARYSHYNFRHDDGRIGFTFNEVMPCFDVAMQKWRDHCIRSGQPLQEWDAFMHNFRSQLAGVNDRMANEDDVDFVVVQILHADSMVRFAPTSPMGTARAILLQSGNSALYDTSEYGSWSEQSTLVAEAWRASNDAMSRLENLWRG